jgi:hypothetical protein
MGLRSQRRRGTEELDDGLSSLQELGGSDLAVDDWHVLEVALGGIKEGSRHIGCLF